MSVLVEVLPKGGAVDTLPVVKLPYWYGTPTRGEVYSYARICLTQEGLRLAITVFDGDPPPTQRAAAAIGLGGGLLWLSFRPDGSAEATYTAPEKQIPLPTPACTWGRGSDEQGWYWQVDCTLTDRMLALCGAAAKSAIPRAAGHFPVGFFLLDDRDAPGCFGAAFCDPAVQADPTAIPTPARCLGQAVVLVY